MSYTNGSVGCQCNGNSETTELKCTANGYHNEEVFEKEPKGHLLMTNGSMEQFNHINGNIPLFRSCLKDESIPFDLLPGETIEQSNCGKESLVLLTNFRLFACQTKGFYNIPVRSIEYAEMRDLLGLVVHCKDGKVMRIGFDSPDDCSEWWRYITSSEAAQFQTKDLFAFVYYNAVPISPLTGMRAFKSLDAEGDVPMYVSEIRRMGFNTKKIWRTTEINSKYQLCKTYPKFHIVPACISDDDIKRVAQFRSLRRFPSVVWRYPVNGAVIARSSQPEVGWLGWRCNIDESMLPAIGRAAMLDSSSRKVDMTMSATNVSFPTLPFLVIDARSYAAAVANRAKGGGCECQEYYPDCDIKFMGLPNIHAIRKSFQSVRALCLLGQEQNNWWSALEGTKWLNYLSGLIKSALSIVEAIDVNGQSILVHCSDGWDRTPQLVSLAQLLLDPYYRTIKGFRVLIEREWLEFGHKFADRCGHGVNKDINERSPVFFQWLDAVYQIMWQFPCAFEFNEIFLVKLVSHAYSCLFGTFLCNSLCERQNLNIRQHTASIWNLLLSGRKDFTNYLYSKNEKVLYPSHHMRSLHLWETLFIGRSPFLCDINHLINNFAKSIEPTDSANLTMSSELNNRIKNDQFKIDTKENSGQASRVRKKSYFGERTLKPDIDKSDPVDVVESNSKLIFSSTHMNSNKDNILENRKKKNSISFVEETFDPLSNKQMISSSNKNEINSLDKSDDFDSYESKSTFSNECIEKEFQKNEILLKSPEILSPGNQSYSDTMSDSQHTLTGDNNEHGKSLDDLCINLSKKTQPENLDLSLGTLDIRGGSSVRRAHSSPDSPPLPRLQRTKSVPDVMAASVCVNSDLVKQYPIIGGSRGQLKLASQCFKRHIDIDGLILTYSFIDRKLFDIQSRHSQDMMKLQRKYEAERHIRLQLQQQHLTFYKNSSPGDYSDGIPDDIISLTDSASGERSSLSSISNDEGWEQIQFDDVQPTRWLPDHVTTHCYSCGCLFNVLIRKHHCRKCGGIFCDTCSNYQIALPEEQLYNPVRVCEKCYHTNLNVPIKLS